MLGWWKKSEGFEWHEYVRTTILVRRQRRKEQLVEARKAAVGGLRAAGQAGASAGASGLAAGGRGLRRGSAAALAGLAAGLGWLGRVLAPVGRAGLGGLESLGIILADPIFRGPAIVYGLAAIALAGWRLSEAGGVTDTLEIRGAAGLAALALGILALPWVVSGVPGRWLSALGARVPARARPPRWAVAGVVGLLVAGGAGWAGWAMLSPGEPGSPASQGATAPVAAARSLTGTAGVVTGDSLRVAGAVVRLAGVEAPERGQRCTAANGKAWACGTAAADALGKLVRAKKVSCEITGRSESGLSLGICRMGTTDVGAELVKGGHVFAAGGFLSSRYAGLESKAKGAKAGLWKGTPPERPQDWRAKRWDEAKRAAPDGCPIKGRLTSEGRVYVLPWAADYERARVSPKRGERWFCTETEARAAGFKLAEQRG